ncbi:MAG TPA: chromosome segregation protein SMC [Vicinamibacterales bacterium]|nr:chromosome segregation protein SMC [Vicinamibacterales bacterium]
MRLEKLEINGFKSFSVRSELAFDKGVTAIVGPNGCGKSNVADAITWVMGEQSAKSLRGEKMEDVIFSGSDARRPTATAEVRLRFSGVVKSVSGPAFNPGARNGSGVQVHGVLPPEPSGAEAAREESDGGVALLEQPVPGTAGPADRIVFAADEAEELIQTVAREVEVTRRLYRSGESEYLIDGHACRLRDIHDLLMDTGLGAKAYAIIEQGKIGLILSTRPTDRRQLIEEAAGVTKYKARRRSAELKLEAAQQNLTRIDDIVFEVEKQRGTLKRQAGKARRYRKLRDELRRWEKVLFARKYRQLAESIESARARLADAREREAAAAGRVSEIESDFGRSRIELAEAESRATATREVAHAAELEINRLQQQIVFDGGQADTLSARARAVEQEIDVLHARREPARVELDERRAAALTAVEDRDRAAAALAAESEAYDLGHRDIEGLEADVEAARSEVFSAINSATALRHSLESAAAQRDRVLEALSKLQVESEDVRIEFDRLEGDRASAAEGLRRAHEALDGTRVARTARESELASASIEHEWRARAVRSREHELAGLVARLKSLEELEAGRVEYGDAARTLLAQANGHVSQKGAVADYLEVDAGRERAVEAYLGDLLQHIIVERQDHAFAGFEVLRDASAGRCGFVVIEGQGAADTDPGPGAAPSGFVALSSVVRVNGPYGDVLRRAIGEAWLTDSYERAEAAAPSAPCAVVTAEGEVFRGPHLVAGGHPKEARGILETKREIKDLRTRIEAEREALARLAAETADLERVMTEATQAIAALNAEQHRQEKQIIALDAQLQRASEDSTKVTLKGDQLSRERRQAEDERRALELRQEEARASILTLEQEQRLADERLTAAQRTLFEARERVQELSRRAAEARAAHAGLVERASGLASEVRRLEESSREMEVRAELLASELDDTRRKTHDLRAAVASGEARLAGGILELDELRAAVAGADDAVSTLRISADACESAIRVARGELEAIRATVSEYDVARATAESDLSHLAAVCVDTVQATLDEVMVEVEELERTGGAVPDARAILAEEPDEATDEEGLAVVATSVPAVEAADAAVAAAEQRTLSAEDAIATLRAKIDRLGPVNMMAIEQYDELEARYLFLSTQRTDLVDSIAQTTEAIRRIDETTRVRFVEAFAAINRNFQEVFTTLFGGGRAGLTLLDENDPLESGIEIVAQPPGKRLQSVQLLSGGEKALTAISLMFGLFKYKPSPFCLLDEIDAPLDDANIGRFVEMLRSMQDHTQFILITHHRKTMEIADRLYGVTMEEPGVSKLISVQMN